MKRSKIVSIFLLIALFSAAIGLIACSSDKTVRVTLYGEAMEKNVFDVEVGSALPVVEVEDKDFEGYWTDASYSAKYEGTTVPEGGITLFYKLSAQYYTLDIDYGLSGVLSFVMQRGVDETIPLISPDGVTVSAYADEKDGVAKYPANGTVRNLAEKNGRATLYPCYEINDVADFDISDGVVTGYHGDKTEISLPLGATKIADYAFRDNADLVSVTVPGTYTAIGKGAFSGCEALESLTVPFVGGGWYNHRFLAYIFGAERYEDNYFSFAAYSYGNSLYIGDENFDNLFVPQSLKTLRVIGRVTEIPEGAFYSAYSLENVVFDDASALTKIGKSAFENCVSFGYDSGLQTPIRLGWLSSVREIEEKAFASYTGNADSKVDKIEISNGIYAERITYMYPFNNLTEISPLTAIETIGSNAFFYCVGLSGVEFGENLKSIGEQSFYFCMSISDLRIPDSCRTIGDLAFYANTSLLTLTLGSGLESIGVWAFADNSALAQVVCYAVEPPVMSKQAFCNSLVSDGSDGYNMEFTGFRIYVDGSQAAAYRAGWPEYSDYIYEKRAPRAPAYWTERGEGWDAKIEFTEGWIVYVTDPEQKFIGSVDFWNFGEMTYGATAGTYYPMICEIVDEKTYAENAAGTKGGKHSKPLYGNQTLIHIWHPELLGYDGGANMDLYYTISPSFYSAGGENYLLPVAEQNNYRATDIGDMTAPGTYVISYNNYGVPALGVVRNQGGFPYVEYLGDPDGTYFCAITEEDDVYTVTYYDDSYAVITTETYIQIGKTASYTSWSDPIYKKTDDHYAVVFNDIYNDSNTLMLNGRGAAVIYIDKGKTRISAQAYDDADRNVGEDGYTVTFRSSDSGLYLGSAVFYDFYEGAYIRCELIVNDFAYTLLNVRADMGWYTSFYEHVTSVKVNLPKNSNDLNDDEWRYKMLTDVRSDGYIRIYELKPDDTTSVFSFWREYDETGALVRSGTFETLADGSMEFLYPDGSRFTATRTDQRGSFVLDGRKYTRYVDSEDATFVLIEDFYGTSLYYYTIKLDGYGNMYYLDEHDDGIYNVYLGTYDDYSEFPSATSTYYELLFTGNKLDENGNKTDEEIALWFVYDFATLSSAPYEGDDDAMWAGVIANILTDRNEDRIVVYDDFGYKLYELTVDVYGEVNAVEYSYTLDRTGKATYTALDMCGVAQFIAVVDTSGDVSYCYALDETGVALFSVRKGADNRYRRVYDGGTRIVENSTARSVTIDLSKLQKI